MSNPLAKLDKRLRTEDPEYARIAEASEAADRAVATIRGTLKRARYARGLAGKGAAAQMGVTPATVSALENAGGDVGLRTMLRYLGAIGLDIDELGQALAAVITYEAERETRGGKVEAPKTASSAKRLGETLLDQVLSMTGERGSGVVDLRVPAAAAHKKRSRTLRVVTRNLGNGKAITITDVVGSTGQVAKAAAKKSVAAPSSGKAVRAKKVVTAQKAPAKSSGKAAAKKRSATKPATRSRGRTATSRREFAENED